jgi:hypothetical protein
LEVDRVGERGQVAIGVRPLNLKFKA